MAFRHFKIANSLRSLLGRHYYCLFAYSFAEGFSLAMEATEAAMVWYLRCISSPGRPLCLRSAGVATYSCGNT